MLRGLVMLFLVPGAVWADAWRALEGAEIAGLLTDQTLIYENATQQFFASGRTLYDAGQDSWGIGRCVESNIAANGRRVIGGIVMIWRQWKEGCGSSARTAA